MKQIKSIIVSCFAIICVALFGSVFTSCSNEEYDSSDSYLDIDRTSNVEAMKSFLSDELGFSLDNIENVDSTLIAEKDICFDVNGFWERYGLTKALTRHHYRSTYTVTSNHRYILITTPQSGADGELPISWLTALVNAVDAWNSLNGGIHFTFYQGDPYNATIPVVYWYAGQASDVAAIANFPDSNGKPGSYIKINPNCSYNFTANERTFVMIHELGHCIGFKHTDQNSGVLLNSGDQNFDDPNSVMHNQVINNPTPPYFTQYDIAAYNLLYP